MHYRPTARRAPQAFTLIELLVVIAIIAILAAILFPVFAQAKSAAKKTTATSNLKQNGLAVSMYTNDNDGVFPQSVYTDDVTKNGQFTGANPANTKVYSAFDVIQPYTKSREIYDDPAETNAIPWKTILDSKKWISPAGIEKVGVCFNFTLFEDPGVPSPIGGLDPVRSESSLSIPADTAMFYSAGYTAQNAENKYSAEYKTAFLAKGGDTRYVKPTLPFGRHNFGGAPRHSGQLVINFADTHVKSYRGNAALPGTAVNSANKTVNVYNLPWDLNGIPDLIDEPTP